MRSSWVKFTNTIRVCMYRLDMIRWVSKIHEKWWVWTTDTMPIIEYIDDTDRNVSLTTAATVRSYQIHILVRIREPRIWWTTDTPFIEKSLRTINDEWWEESTGGGCTKHDARERLPSRPALYPIRIRWSPTNNHFGTADAIGHTYNRRISWWHQCERSSGSLTGFIGVEDLGWTVYQTILFDDWRQQTEPVVQLFGRYLSSFLLQESWFLESKIRVTGEKASQPIIRRSFGREHVRFL